MTRFLRPSLAALLAARGVILVPGREHDLAAVAVDDVVGRLLAAPVLGDVGDRPAVLAADEGDPVVEGVEDLLARHVERVEERGHRKLALAVDPDVDDVLGVELEVEPGAAIGDDPGGEEIFARGVGLAAVMVEENARRTVHLRDDDALGAVDDERAVLRHQRHVAHVDVLLLDIEDGAGLGIGIDLEDDQAQSDAHRRRIGHAALAALVDVVFRLFELVMDEVQFGGAGEVADREDAAQGLLQARHVAVLRSRAEELLVALALNLDEVRHFGDFVDVAEDLADALGSHRPVFAGPGRLDRHGDVSRLFSSSRRKPGSILSRCASFERGQSPMRAARKTQKAASPCLWNRSFSVSENPLSINALNALRDGASCSDAMGCGR